MFCEFSALVYCVRNCIVCFKRDHDFLVLSQESVISMLLFQKFYCIQLPSLEKLNNFAKQNIQLNYQNLYLKYMIHQIQIEYYFCSERMSNILTVIQIEFRNKLKIL